MWDSREHVPEAYDQESSNYCWTSITQICGVDQESFELCNGFGGY